MKNNKKILRALVFSLMALGSTLPVLWMQQGCQGTYPLPSVMVVTPTPTLAPNVVTDFETGGTGINPYLLGVNGYPGSFVANTYGGSPPNSINNPFVLGGPGNGSQYGIHIACSLSGTGAYEADQLVCNLIKAGAPSPYFDATSFSGVQFDINIMPSDTNPQRVFQVGTDVTTPNSAPGGTCPSGCYNHYQANLGAPTGGWVTRSYAWTALVYPGYGTNNGPNVSTHLTKFIFLQWSESANGAVVTTSTDFWIDNVQFY
jgi:hypothetical protein